MSITINIHFQYSAWLNNFQLEKKLYAMEMLIWKIFQIYHKCLAEKKKVRFYNFLHKLSFFMLIDFYSWLQTCPDDRYTEWSTWSLCTASCGPGIKMRSRQLLYPEQSDKDDEKCKMQMLPCIAEISSCNYTTKEAEGT